MARFCPLFSSSSGNSYLIGDKSNGYVLIDAGVSARRLEMGLRSIDVEPSEIKAIFVTHEHHDHISGLRVFSSRYKTMVYATGGTLECLEDGGHLKGVIAEALPEGGIDVAGMGIYSFPTPHDSKQSCGYRIITTDGRKVGIATDIGIMTDEVRMGIIGCDLIVIESNHDTNMLCSGRYPYYLKQRILSEKGHLCNDRCADELPALVESGTTRILLGHLSRENNMPELARLTALNKLNSAEMKEGYDYILSVASPENSGDILLF